MQLKHCPFCGGPATEIVGLVGCEPCAIGRRDAASWNRRVPLPAEPAAEWIEAMARAIDPHGCNWENQLPGPLKDFARQQARAAYAALARKMEGRDAE